MATQLRSIFTGLTTDHRRRLGRLLSSSVAISCPRNRPANFFASEPESCGSSPYRHSLKFAQPSSLSDENVLSNLFNRVSFIGTVALPLKNIAGHGNSGVYTVLRVSRVSNHQPRPLRILLNLWHELAEVAIEHLKVDDFIYVSGCLGSYDKVFPDGRHKMFYLVTVNELNYVKQPENVQKADSVESRREKSRKRLHLWQIFFANPFEWYDCRRSKEHDRQPDFKNKHTGEALWLSVYDPPWVRKQLELHESRMAICRRKED